MREIGCPICSKNEKTLVFQSTLPEGFDETSPPSPYSAHYQINKCPLCGLFRSSPIMDDAGVSALYKNSSETNVQPGEEGNVARTMRQYYRLAVPHLFQKQRVLDVGCDMGFFLEAAKLDGFAEVHGIEPNPQARRIAEKIDGAILSSHFFEATAYPPDHFDLITLIHVLDHLVDPRIVLKHALVNLQSGGLLVAVVHNVDSLLFRLLGEKFPIFNLYHHYFFSKNTLALLFRAQGYEVIKVVSTSNCYSLGFFAKRVPIIPKSFREVAFRFLERTGLASIPINIPVGNIGIVARKPLRANTFDDVVVNQ